MAITGEQGKVIFQKIKMICLKIAKKAHTVIGTIELKSNPFLTDEYPALFTDVFYNEKSLKKTDYEKVSFLKYHINRYEMSRFPENRLYYDAVFDGYKKEGIKLNNYKEIEEIKQWIESEPEVLKCFTKNDKLSDYVVRMIIYDIVVRYLYMTNATESIPENLEELITPFIIEKLRFYFDDELFFDICVPVCLATFEKEIKIDDCIEIVKIPEDIQKARQAECKYEIANEDWVAACATHMIVLHNYHYKKRNDYTFDYVIQDYSFYPADVINELMGIIRTVTGCDIGYEQVLCIPNGWVHDTKADLTALYGAKTHFVNPKYLNCFWMFLPVSTISNTQCDDIARLYSEYKKNEKKLRFALMRFNRCCLRDEIDDMTIDACIGLESLLAGGTHSEITYTISNRIPFVLSKISDSRYLSINGRKTMKKIYDLRSRIAHGSEVKEKDMYLEIDKEKKYIPKIAVDFLQIVLLFMIQNPDYIGGARIDEQLDSFL